MKFDRRNRRVNVKTVKKEMWNVIKEAREKSFLEKENIENEAEEPEANFCATTFTDMQEELQSKLEGENKGKHHNNYSKMTVKEVSARDRNNFIEISGGLKFYFRKLDSCDGSCLCALFGK